ncbi:MAG: hypothetical protein AAFN77_22690 [Planctomycetota bacterium]
MNIAIVIFALLILHPQEAVSEYDVPGLGRIDLPDGKWKLEDSKTPERGANVHVFKKETADVERITIVRFKKTQGERGLVLKDSYAFCDDIADSAFTGGASSNWGPVGEKQDEDQEDTRTNHMIRLPTESSAEPLAVTNICASENGKHWMNHGLIASNKEYVFLFIHTSTKLLSPETIENVYFSSPLKTWPRLKKNVR